MEATLPDQLAEVVFREVEVGDGPGFVRVVGVGLVAEFVGVFALVEGGEVVEGGDFAPDGGDARVGGVVGCEAVGAEVGVDEDHAEVLVHAYVVGVSKGGAMIWSRVGGINYLLASISSCS